MKLGDFDYDLPEELIAQEPSVNRDASRLMTLDRATGQRQIGCFTDILGLVQPGDVLVLNDTKVFAARVPARKEATGGLVELFFLQPEDDNRWKAMVRPGRRLRPGAQAVTSRGGFRVTIEAEVEDGLRLLAVDCQGLSMQDFFRMAGEVPLPPYIHQSIADPDRYQTVYAKEEGSVAAPTAGLHFTAGLLKQIEERGVGIQYLTLHVGIGTFRPVVVQDITAHRMHQETYTLSPATAAALNDCKAKGGRIIAVGTTCVRTLETCTDAQGLIHPGAGQTDMYIYPGYRFRCVDAMVTNFHLPKSSLLMLVSAFAGPATVRAAYEEAISSRMRFFSFGDAMFIY